MKLEELSHAVIGAALEVHSQLGPGLLEAMYVEALHCELRLRGIAASREVDVPVRYKHLQLQQSLRLDLLVEDQLVVEAKSAERLHAVHAAQLLTYLKLSDKKLGLLLNFNVASLKQGIKRISNGA